MSELLGLDHLALTAEGPTLSMGVHAGQSVGILGPAASGKTSLLRLLAGLERPAQGAATRRTDCLLVTEGGLPKRVKVQTLARQQRVAGAAALATEALVATRLWSSRTRSLAELSPSQMAAAELLQPLTSGIRLLLFDGHLDRLDPWVLGGVTAFLRTLRSAGTAVIVATNRPELVHSFDAVIVLNDLEVRFAGSLDDLMRSGPPQTLTVATERQESVRALVSPFSVSVRDDPSGLRLEAAEGQELAARLLLEGYGDVRFAVVRPPTVEDALRALIS